MKKILFLSLCFLASVFCVAQVKDPVKWSFTSKKISKDTYEIHLTAAIDPGWHIYSQTTPEGGPVSTDIVFTTNPLLIIESKPKEVGKLETRHEDLFGVDVKQFSNRVDFVQKIKLKGSVKTSVNGSVEFMVCNDSQCLPPETEKFSISLN